MIKIVRFAMIKHPKFPNGNIYLSGGMQFAENLGAGWRVICGMKLKQSKYFPLDITELDIAYTAVHGELYRSFGSDEVLQMKSNIRKHFIYTDLELIVNDSDAMIIYYDESVRLGAGTISECQVAYNNDIPVFLVSAYGDDLNEIPGWLQALTTKMFTSFDDLHTYLDALPEGILKRDVYGNHNAGNMYLCSLCGEPFKKHKQQFVSKVSPLYCGCCVDLVSETVEEHKDRYEFFINYLQDEADKENR